MGFNSSSGITSVNGDIVVSNTSKTTAIISGSGSLFPGATQGTVPANKIWKIINCTISVGIGASGAATAGAFWIKGDETILNAVSLYAASGSGTCNTSVLNGTYECPLMTLAATKTLTTGKTSSASNAYSFVIVYVEEDA